MVSFKKLMRLEAGRGRCAGQPRPLLSQVKVARNDLTLADLALVERRGGARLDAEGFPPVAPAARPGWVSRWLGGARLEG
jgi:hypothetical protein